MEKDELNLFSDPHLPLKLTSNSLLKIVALISIFWLPIFLLSLINAGRGEGSDWLAPLRDATLLVRFIWVLPVLYSSFHYSNTLLNRVVEHFIQGKLVSEEDRSKIGIILEEASWPNQGSLLKWALIGVSYAVSLFMAYSQSFTRATYLVNEDHLSYAGFWLFFISYPFFYFTLFSILMRALMWWSLMFKISGLRLNVTSAHGDRRGGLSFLALSIKAFIIPVLALSSSAVAGMLKLPLEELTLNYLRISFLLTFCLYFCLFVGPLFIFLPQLQRAKNKGVLLYGTIMRRQIQQLQQKWDKRGADNDLLSVPDFSSVNDTSGLVQNVNEMRILPFVWKDLVLFGLAVFIPYVPILATKISWEEMIKKLLTIVF